MTTFRSRRNAADRFGDRRRDRRGRRADAASTRRRLSQSAALKPVPAKLFAARLAVLRQEVAAQPIDQRAKRRLRLRAVSKRQPSQAAAAAAPDVGRQHRELRMTHRAVVEERVEPAADAASSDVAQPRRRPSAGRLRRSDRAGRAPGYRRSACGATSRRRAAPRGRLRSRRSPSCANTSATSSSSRASAAADAERLIERLADQARHLGVVGQVEPGIDVGLERKLAQQRQAERVDRRDRDVAEALLELAPPRRVELATGGSLPAAAR